VAVETVTDPESASDPESDSSASESATRNQRSGTTNDDPESAIRTWNQRVIRISLDCCCQKKTTEPLNPAQSYIISLPSDEEEDEEEERDMRARPELAI
jgi:hypothetical protein